MSRGRLAGAGAAVGAGGRGSQHKHVFGDIARGFVFGKHRSFDVEELNHFILVGNITVVLLLKKGINLTLLEKCR